MVTSVPSPSPDTEIERRYDHAIKQRDLRAFAHTIVRAPRQVEIEHALLETSRIARERSRDLIRETRETLARARLSMEALRKTRGLGPGEKRMPRCRYDQD